MTDAPPGKEPEYAGLMTRVIAFIADAVIINLIALLVEAGAAVAIALFHLPKHVTAILVVIGGIAYVVWTIAYFVTFWSATGQTPGARLMQIRLSTADGDRVGLRRGFWRCFGMVLAALPLFAGYLLILVDGRRRGLQDRLARTLVLHAPTVSLAAQRRDRRRSAYERQRDHADVTRPAADVTRSRAMRDSSVSGDERSAGAGHAVVGREHHV